MLVLEAGELAQVRAILGAHLPAAVQVGVFGSRVEPERVKPMSDLDLVLEGTEPLPLSLIAELREAFDESALPFKVDLVDRCCVDPTFGAIIDAAKLPLER
jgi:predicted nucleotidyltransferase